MKSAVKVVYPNIANLGTIVGVWAHPDDETFMMAGVMAMAATNGQTVASITATKGELGVRDETRWPIETLGKVRAGELQEAMTILGVKNHHWLEYKDGSCIEADEKQAIQEVYELLQTYHPDTVITFPPDGLTGHDDHRSVSHWALEAIKRLDYPVTLYYAVDTQEAYDNFIKPIDEQFNVYFNVDEPVLIPRKACDIDLELPTEIANRKVAALKIMPSQTDGMFNALGDEKLKDAFCCENFVLAERKDIAWN